MKIISLVLVTIGILVLMSGGISFKRQKTILDVGGIKATASEQHNVPLTPILGVISIIGGVVLLVVNERRMRPAKA